MYKITNQIQYNNNIHKARPYMNTKIVLFIYNCTVSGKQENVACDVIFQTSTSWFSF